MRRLVKDLALRSGYLIRRRYPSECQSASIHGVFYKRSELRFLVFDPADAIQAHHVQGRIYEERIIERILTYFSEGLFLDIGANVGNHAIAVVATKDSIRAKCFEPHPDAFALLSANIALNRMRDRIETFDAGLSDTEGIAQIGTPHHNLGGSTLEGNIRGRSVVHRVNSCRTCRGDDLIREAPSFIKIDVEGHELRVLAGLRCTIEKYKPPMFVEVDRDTDLQVKMLLLDLGYKEDFRDRADGLVRGVFYVPR